MGHKLCISVLIFKEKIFNNFVCIIDGTLLKLGTFTCLTIYCQLNMYQFPKINQKYKKSQKLEKISINRYYYMYSVSVGFTCFPNVKRFYNFLGTFTSILLLYFLTKVNFWNIKEQVIFCLTNPIQKFKMADIRKLSFLKSWRT